MRLKLSAWRLLPMSLFARMAAILFAGLLAAQLTSVWLQSGERAAVVSQARGLNFLDRVAEAVRTLEAEAPERRDAVLAALRADGLRVTLIRADEVLPNTPRGQIRAMLGMRLGSERELRSEFGGGPMRGHSGMMMQQGAQALRSIDLRLRDGQWIRIAQGPEAPPPDLPGELISKLLASLLIVSAVVIIAVRQATRPLQQLAQAANTLGHDLDAPPLIESGPSETRRAAQAFNRMQDRIRRLVGERARALAAVSHDLRTPLTRLRLRAELVDDEKLREQMIVDLETMAAMLDATLDYLRGLSEKEVPRAIDMNALAHSLAEDAAVLGKVIRVEGAAHSPYTGRLSALRRALQNLVDNAIKHGYGDGHGARIRIDDGATLRLFVEDDGPGIAPGEIERVSEPYYRPDASRSRETGGVGLGLSIARDIALLHGGQLVLANRPQGGLSASLELPRQRVSPAAHA